MNTVKRIHMEIDTAADRLLLEAKQIIDSANAVASSEKISRLIKIGFTGLDAIKALEPIVKTKELASLIEYHKSTYPFQKFLTEEEFNRICEKYSLIYAPINKYKKDVPDKNITDIENVCDLKMLDIEGISYSLKVTAFYSHVDVAKAKYFENWQPIPNAVAENILSITHSASKWAAVNDYIKDTVKTSDPIASTFAIQNNDRSGLFIAAPKSHFNLEGLKKKGFGYFNITKIVISEPKDPIVFRYVRGGIQVITKWGLEASDSALTNEKEN